jgi:two-component system, OmpR family, alkaline phosphatase synthesis response regulator PhoP
MEQKIKVLIVDDEPDITEFLAYNLSRHQYEVMTASQAEEGWAIALSFRPDLFILDIMMPGKSGVELCQDIRKNPLFQQSLIVMLTARQEDHIQIQALDFGADDYITKPLKPSVFLSRLQALFRRIEPNASKSLEFGDLIIDPVNYTVQLKAEMVELPKKEFETLFLLASKPGKVFSRTEILSKVWGKEVIVGDRTIDVHIRKLREKIGDHYVQTIKGVGYKFVF